MKIKTKFKDLFLVQQNRFLDNRGYFKELIQEYKLNLKFPFVVMSFSKKNVIRGLHIQTKNSQGKLLSVIKGKIFDVALDLRKNSKTFGRHFKIVLTEKKARYLFVPKGFAHGFLGLEKENIVLYSCSNYRYSNYERSIRWNDKDLDINWGVKKPIISKRDSKASTLKEYIKNK